MRMAFLEFVQEGASGEISSCYVFAGVGE